MAKTMKEVSKRPSRHVKNSLILLALMLFFLVAPFSVARIPTISNVYAEGTGPELLIQPDAQPIATPGSTVTFKVSVANMPVFAGWDVYVRSDPSVLKPTTITLGNFMPAGFEVTHCINGIGTSCTQNDKTGVAHDSFASFGLVSGTGALFTITYTAVAGPGTMVSFPESVTGNSGLNALFDTSGNNITGVPEIGGIYGGVLGAEFSFPVSLQIGQGAIFNSTVCCGTLPYSYSWTFGDGGVSTASSPNHVFSSAGTFDVTLSVSDSGIPQLFRSVSHFVTVVSTDFALSATSIRTLVPGAQGISTISVKGISRFNGTITLALAPSRGLSVSLNANNIALNTSTTSQIATLTVAGNTPGTYSVLIIGTSPNYPSHSTAIIVSVSDFSVRASSAIIQSLSGSGMTMIAVSGLDGFAGNVSLTASQSSGLTASITPTFVVGSGTSVLNVNGNPGVYSVIVTGSSPGFQQHALKIIVDLGVDFSVFLSPVGQVAPNSSATSNVTVRAINGFGGTISLAFIPAPGLTFSVDSTSITLTPNSVTTGVARLSFVASNTGHYDLTVVASSQGLTHTSHITIIVKNGGGSNGAGSILNLALPRLLTETIWALSAIAIILSLTASILAIKLRRKKN